MMVRILRTWGRQLGLLLPIALVFHVLGYFLDRWAGLQLLYLREDLYVYPGLSSLLRYAAFWWLLRSVQVALHVVLIGACSAALYARLCGRPGRLRDAFGALGSRWLSLVALAFTVGLTLAAGWAVWVIPALVLGACLIVAAPALTVERLGVMAAWKRSFALTAGHRWRILGVVLLLAVVWWGFELGFAEVGWRLPELPPLQIAYFVLWNAFGLLFAALLAAASTVAYHDLRRGEVGPGDDGLEEVFA